MTELHDALEACLNALEAGQSIDAVVAQYPHLARELRPLLEASLLARRVGQLPVSPHISAVGRARVLQRAILLRESRWKPQRRFIPALPRLAITIVLAAVLVLTSTGLVSASSGALPGDQLYGVKRTWEDIRLLFVFHPQDRDLLESSYEQERLDEIDELLVKGRAAPITFLGLVMQQQDGNWLVSGIRVSISAATVLPARPIAAGEPVVITGATRADGRVEAQTVRLLQPGVSLPPLEPSGEENEDEASEQPGAESVPTAIPGEMTPVASQNSAYQFTGVVQSMEGTTWKINGQTVHVDGAQINGSISLGSVVTFEGYYSADGKFVVTQIDLASPAALRKHDTEANSGQDAGGDSKEGGSDDGAGGGESGGGDG